jgi:exosome complex RNA-binding protein Rrp4
MPRDPGSLRKFIDDSIELGNNGRYWVSRSLNNDEECCVNQSAMEIQKYGLYDSSSHTNGVLNGVAAKVGGTR